MVGYHLYWKMKDAGDRLTFSEKKQKLVDTSTALRQVITVNEIVGFDPLTPETNMVLGYLFFWSKDACEKARDFAFEMRGVRVLHRIREVMVSDPAFALRLPD